MLCRVSLDCLVIMDKRVRWEHRVFLVSLVRPKIKFALTEYYSAFLCAFLSVILHIYKNTILNRDGRLSASVSFQVQRVSKE